jgi:hypothetical protein
MVWGQGGQAVLWKEQTGSVFLQCIKSLEMPAAQSKINTTSCLSKACNSIQKAGLPSPANDPSVTEAYQGL